MPQTNTLSQKQTLLLVDDNQMHLEYILRVFEDQPFKIRTANDGDDALQKIKSFKPDLILLDIIMPGINGFELCQQLKEKDETAGIPVIFLTSKTDQESVIRGLELGGTDYITIPFNPDELKIRVKNQLSLKKKYQELESKNKDLSQTVNERTQQLEETDKPLKDTEKTKADFLTLLSYKIRTPLNTIMGFTQILENLLKDERHLKNLKMIKGASEKLNQIADTAILITSLNSDKIKKNFTEINIKDIIKLAIDEHDNELNGRNIVTITDIEPFTMNGDGRLIKISIHNILENAIRHSPSNSQIEILTYQDNDKKVIELSDEGPGFDENALEVIKNFSIDEPLPRFNSNEFGLGLITTKLIIDIHEGKLTAKNKSEKGASVKLSFPTE